MKQETIIFWLGLVVFSFISAVSAALFSSYAFIGGAIMGILYTAVWELSRYVQSNEKPK